MADQTRVTETARKNRETTGPYEGVQGRPADPTGALEVEKRMGVSLAAAGQKGFVPPKQDPGEDMATYARRVSEAREAFKQKQAMK